MWHETGRIILSLIVMVGLGSISVCGAEEPRADQNKFSFYPHSWITLGIYLEDSVWDMESPSERLKILGNSLWIKLPGGLSLFSEPKQSEETYGKTCLSQTCVEIKNGAKEWFRSIKTRLTWLRRYPAEWLSRDIQTTFGITDVRKMDTKNQATATVLGGEVSVPLWSKARIFAQAYTPIKIKGDEEEAQVVLGIEINF